MNKERPKIACIAIDDEPLALDLIESYIKKIPYLDFRGGYADPVQALEVLKNEKIDLVYLDINMPDISGIDLLKGLSDRPKVVFITAYDAFAVQGFELNAVDYLLKPVSFSRFLLTAERVLEIMSLKKISPPVKHNFIFVKSEHNVLKISFDDIFYIEGYKDYVKIITNEVKPILTLTTIKSINDILSIDEFIRIHKSYIISIQKIKSFRNGKVLVKDKYIPIGDSYRENFNQRIVKGHM